MEIRFDERVILITGATSGIGKESARLFSQSGGQVMLTGCNEEELVKVKDEIETTGGRCRIKAGDLTDTDFRKELVTETITSFGKLDVLINAAGIIGSGTVEKTSLEDFDFMMDINLRTVFHLMQLAIPHLIKSKGNIVNVSSVTGVRAFPGIATYCVSKAGVDQLTRAASLELAPQQVRVNAINPGVMITNLHKRGGMDKEAYNKFLEHSKTTHPMGRVGEPEEAAQLIVFLASDSAGWVTGLTASIDGGRHLTCAR
jgi:NAD(P)-dependent dehydrogenase (short-subunit alcohol dehydrogenase family)